MLEKFNDTAIVAWAIDHLFISFVIIVFVITAIFALVPTHKGVKFGTKIEQCIYNCEELYGYGLIDTYPKTQCLQTCENKYLFEKE